jgi:PHP family Zn ribbon phosphoesterase
MTRRYHTVDLHNHTPFVSGDYRAAGTVTAEQLIRAAARTGVDVLGVTDHFSVGFVSAMQDAASKQIVEGEPSVLVIPGAELRITWEDDETHLVALFRPEAYERQFAEVCRLLNLNGQLVDPRSLPSLSVEADPVEVVRAIDALGGMCHIGHVDRCFGAYCLKDTEMLDRLVDEAPISAVEVVESDSCLLLGHRMRHVSCIRSSDSHAVDQIGRRATMLELDEQSFDGLKRALMSGAPHRFVHEASRR